MWNENKTPQFVCLSSRHQGPIWNAFPSYLSRVSPWVTSTSHMLLNNALHSAFLSLDEFYGFTLSSNKISNHKPFFFFYQLTWLCLYHVSYLFLPLSHGALYWYKLWPYLYWTIILLLSSKIIIFITSNYSPLKQFST